MYVRITHIQLMASHYGLAETQISIELSDKERDYLF